MSLDISTVRRTRTLGKILMLATCCHVLAACQTAGQPGILGPKADRTSRYVPNESQVSPVLIAQPGVEAMLPRGTSPAALTAMSNQTADSGVEIYDPFSPVPMAAGSETTDASQGVPYMGNDDVTIFPLDGQMTADLYASPRVSPAFIETSSPFVPTALKPVVAAPLDDTPVPATAAAVPSPVGVPPAMPSQAVPALAPVSVQPALTPLPAPVVAPLPVPAPLPPAAAPAPMQLPPADTHGREPIPLPDILKPYAARTPAPVITETTTVTEVVAPGAPVPFPGPEAQPFVPRPDVRDTGIKEKSLKPLNSEPDRIYFAHGEEKLDAQDKNQIEDIAVRVATKSLPKVRVEGHASEQTATSDPVEGRMINFKMSMRRALSVTEQLLLDGVEPSKIETVAYGATRPAAAMDGKSAAEASRRVEVYTGHDLDD